jgi:hypothetical protein
MTVAGIENAELRRQKDGRPLVAAGALSQFLLLLNSAFSILNFAQRRTLLNSEFCILSSGGVYRPPAAPGRGCALPAGPLPCGRPREIAPPIVNADHDPSFAAIVDPAVTAITCQ